MQQEIWDRTSQYVSCVVSAASLEVIAVALSTSAVSVPVFVAAFTAAASSCGDLVLAEMAQATLVITRGT